MHFFEEYNKSPDNFNFPFGISEKDYDSRDWYKKGMALLSGVGGAPKDIAKGLRYLDTAIKTFAPDISDFGYDANMIANNAGAALGLINLHGLFNCQVNINNAIWYFDWAAQRGQGYAGKLLGDAYYWGKNGISKDQVLAAKYYKMAYEKADHYPEAAYLYGFMILHQQGGLQLDYQLVVNAYKYALLGGKHGALPDKSPIRLEITRFFADVYGNGKGNVPKNEKEAWSYWWAIETATNEAYAQYKVAVGMFNGHTVFEAMNNNVEHREHDSLSWFQKAHENGEANATVFLGWIYENGKCGLKVDKQEALRLYKLAADKRNQTGAKNAAICYEYGKAGSVDLQLSLAYYKKAQEFGAQDVAQSIDRVSSALEQQRQAMQPVKPTVNTDVLYNTTALLNRLNIPFSELRLEGKLGEGGFGIVLKAQWKQMDVAVKIMRQGVLQGDKLNEFNHEMKIMTQLSHPCIISLHGVCIDAEETRYLVMEYATCGSLRNILDDKSTTIPMRTRVGIMIGMVKGLTYLHEQQFLHRDLKSLNVLMQANFQPKLADFGLSKFVADSQNYYTVGGKGTLAWMAPELLTGDKVKFNKEADIYSLTMVFYEILSSQFPYFDVGHLGLILGRIIGGKRPEIPAKTRDGDLVPEGLKYLMNRGWAQDANERPRAPEMLKDLNQISEALQDSSYKRFV